MAPSGYLEATEEILRDIQKILGEQQPKEENSEILLETIKGEIKKSDYKGAVVVILKQNLGNVLSNMKKSQSEGSPPKNPLNDSQKKKVREDLTRIADKAKYLMELESVVGDSSDPKLVGRETEVKEIIDELKRLVRSEKVAVPVIIFAGLAGIGKSKLARHICEDENIRNHFGLPTWVNCTNYSTFVDIATHVAGVTKSSRNRIVVLDDWRIEITDQYVKVLQDKFKEVGPLVTAIMITTRSICHLVRKNTSSPVKSYSLPGLDHVQSKDLFNKTGGQGGAEIVEQCRGVPQAIMIMAKWHNSPRQKSTTFMEELICKYYDERLSDLRFAYCSLFPQDYEFDTERLIHLWMAEEFLKPSENSASDLNPEEIGRSYVKDMVESSIFQQTKENKLGEVISCKMHPLMHDIARFMADWKDITVYEHGNNVHGLVQRASFDLDLNNDSEIPPTLCVKAKELKSLILLKKKPTMQRDLKLPEVLKKKVFTNFKCLSVLNLRNLKIEKVSSSIGKLKELKYLDLSENTMKKLPGSITELSKLETLKLYHCLNLNVLPDSFENLAELKHLDMEGCNSLTCIPSGMSKMDSLQTLSLSAVKRGLEVLAQLKTVHLKILHLELVRVKKAPKKCWENEHLKRLTLGWVEGVKDESHLGILNQLKPNSALEVLIIQDYQAPSFSTWLTDSNKFRSLVKLRLESCCFCKDLSQHDQLPKLRILELVSLENLECIVQECNKRADFYTNLEELTIKRCLKLKSWWNTEQEANDWPLFTNISKQDVVDCPLLRFYDAMMDARTLDSRLHLMMNIL